MFNKQKTKSSKTQCSIASFFNRKKICQKQNINKCGKNPDESIDDNILQPQMSISIGTLMEIEKWVKKAKVGKTRYAFEPIMKQINMNGDVFDDVVHSLTLAQIMPFQEIRRRLKIHDMTPTHDDLGLVCSLAKTYRTSPENVVERIHHVVQIDMFLKNKKNNKTNQPED